MNRLHGAEAKLNCPPPLPLYHYFKDKISKTYVHGNLNVATRYITKKNCEEMEPSGRLSAWWNLRCLSDVQRESRKNGKGRRGTRHSTVPPSPSQQGVRRREGRRRRQTGGRTGAEAGRMGESVETASALPASLASASEELTDGQFIQMLREVPSSPALHLLTPG